MTGAALIRWGTQVPGREAKSLDVFGRSIERFEQLTKEGRLHAHREYIALTGKAGGFTILEGEIEELQKILVEPETRILNAQAEAIVEDFEITLYAGGTDKAVQELIGTYMGAMGDLGYM
jgi:hypothetical protein